MKRLTTLFLLVATNGFGGGTGGGGTPPAFEVDHAWMSELQKGALADDLIRVKRPGEDPVYMKPLKETISTFSMRATALPSGGETVFRTRPGFEVMEHEAGRSATRALGSILPGTLPLLPDDFAVSLEPTVELVSQSVFEETTIRP
jgi:hypothetical protein